MPAEVLAALGGDALEPELLAEAMTQLLEREGWAYTEPEVLFTPMKAMAHAS